MGNAFPGLARVPRFRWPIGLESIFAYRPDAIIAYSDFVPDLRQLGFPVLFDLGQWGAVADPTKWKLLGQILGEEWKAQKILETYQEKRRQLESELDGWGATKVVILAGSYGDDSFIAGSSYYLNWYINVAHGINPAAFSRFYPATNLETLAVLDPDVIVLNSQPDDNHYPEEIFRQPAWQALRAVRERRVYKLPHLAVFLGPVEDPLLWRWFAEILHPDLEPGFRSQYLDTYKSLYNYSPTQDEIDQAIYFAANQSSAGYMRFARPAG